VTRGEVSHEHLAALLEHGARIRTSQELIASFRRPKDGPPDRWQPGATRFREDPFRTNPTIAALLSFINRGDVVLDVDGGAGRYLPLALHCTELINVEPSAAMGQQFEECVRDSTIHNAR
jgi:hypothetical protein